MVPVTQSLHEEFEVSLSSLLCPYLGEIWIVRPCYSLWDDILFAQDFVVWLCFLFPRAQLKVCTWNVAFTLVSNPGTWKWHCRSQAHWGNVSAEWLHLCQAERLVHLSANFFLSNLTSAYLELLYELFCK